MSPARCDVRAAAQLHREVADAQHAHVVLVLLAEQRHRAGGDRAFVVHHLRFGRRVAADLRVHQVLDLPQLVRRDRLEVREVEAQAVRRDERALLRDVRAEHLAQRGVQQMRGGVVERGGAAALAVDVRAERVADRDRALRRAGRCANARCRASACPPR